MAWSIQIFQRELDSIFKEQKKTYNAQHVDSAQPKIIIEYEGEIPVVVKKLILELFPDFVYVDFHPGTVFGAGMQTGIIGIGNVAKRA